MQNSLSKQEAVIRLFYLFFLFKGGVISWLSLLSWKYWVDICLLLLFESCLKAFKSRYVVGRLKSLPLNHFFRSFFLAFRICLNKAFWKLSVCKTDVIVFNTNGSYKSNDLSFFFSFLYFIDKAKFPKNQ